MTLTEISIAVMFWVMIALAAVSFFYPWRPAQPLAKLLLHLPLLLIPSWIAYEMIMPVEMNIRLDLAFLLPAFAAAGLVYLCKIASFRRQLENTKTTQAD